MHVAPGIDVDDPTLALLCQRHGVRELSLFGSAVQGRLRPDSDLDVLVLFEHDDQVGLFQLARLQRDLTALLGRPVDLVPKDGLKPLLRGRVLREARLLYAA